MNMPVGKEERTSEAREARLKRLLVSMRSMDGMDGTAGRNHNFPSLPPGGANGFRPTPRPQSPAYDDYDRHPRQRQQQQQRHRKASDPGTEEMIRFVRGYQLEREPTLLRLKKKAPLPGIGQLNHSIPEPDCDPGRRGERRVSLHTVTDDDDDTNDPDDDFGDYEDVLLDNEVAAIDASNKDPLRHLGLYDDYHCSSVRDPPGRKRSRQLLKPNLSFSEPQVGATHPQRLAIRPLDSHGHKMGGGRAHARKSLGRSLKQLPPIARDELPARPSAPSPSVTPPVEGEDLDSAGEPVDFIDAS